MGDETRGLLQEAHSIRRQAERLSDLDGAAAPRVGNLRKMAGFVPEEHGAEGESSPARRSGIRRRRCTGWRDDGNLANRAAPFVGSSPISCLVHVHSGGKAVVGTVGAPGGAASPIWRNNPMQSKSPMHLSRLSITGGKDLTLYEVDEAATRICEEVDVDAGAWPNALVLRSRCPTSG
jgi:hypothetical protein